MIVQQPVVILVLSQEGVRARPSTLPSWLIITNNFPTQNVHGAKVEKSCDGGTKVTQSNAASVHIPFLEKRMVRKTKKRIQALG